MRATPFTPAGDQIRWSDLVADPDEHDAPARVYLHGLGGTCASVFAHVAPHPALGGHRSLLIDLPGHGLSDRPTDFAYSVDDHAAAVAAVLDATGLQGVEMIGHSMGGSIAIVLAARRPELVSRLVVAEANLDALPPTPTGLGSQQIASYAEAAFVETGYRRLMAESPSWAPTMRLCDPIAVHRSAVALITGTRPIMRELFVALPIPRTFVASTLGEGVTDGAGLEAAGVRVVTIPDAGHSMMNDQPELFARALAEALAAPG